jgi:hypothetical protein
MKHLNFLWLFLIFSTTTISAQHLNVFSTIPGRNASDKYTAKVRRVGTNLWSDAFVIQTTCKVNPNMSDPIKGPNNDNGYFIDLANWSQSYIAFEFAGGPVEVEISKVGGGAITKAKVRPEGHASDARIENGKAYVVFHRNANVNVDIDGQMEDNYTGAGYKGPAVHSFAIFANPIYRAPSANNGRVVKLNPGQAIPPAENWDTIHFQPGVHDIGRAYRMSSEKVFFIPGDAIVHGTVHPENAASQWSIYGSGAISGENLNWLGDDCAECILNKVFTGPTQGIRLEGFVVLDPANHTYNMYNSSAAGNLVNIYKNLKIFGWRKNADGINAFRNSDISDCFIRTQDDVFYLGTNVRISDIVTWTDSNGAVMYLTTDDATGSIFQNISVIYNRKKWHGWNSGIISMRDNKRAITNVVCKNIHCEDPKPTVALFYGFVSGTDSYAHSNILFENISQSHTRVDGNKTVFRGTAAAPWTGFTIKNCSYVGQAITGFDSSWDLTHVNTSGFNFVTSQVQTFPIKLYKHTSNGGTVNGAGLYDINTRVTVSAIAAPGFTFVNWTEDGVEFSKLPIITVRATSARTLIAHFRDNALPIYTSTHTPKVNSARVFPNPSTGIVNVEVQELGNKQQISIYNHLGQLLHVQPMVDERTQVDFKALNLSGSFIMKVSGTQNVSSHQVVITK